MEPLTLFSQSSLTDIVLLLLIFFLLTSSFVTSYGIRVNIPTAESAAETSSQHITVAVTADGDFFVDGELTSEGTLSSAIREAQQNKPEGMLVLRADKDVILDHAVRVMNIGQVLGLRVILATERE